MGGGGGVPVWPARAVAEVAGWQLSGWSWELFASDGAGDVVEVVAAVF